MIRIQTPEGYLLVGHQEHARLAGRFAARWGNAATVRLLLLRGALKHLVTHDGRTACELGADHPLVLVELM